MRRKPFLPRPRLSAEGAFRPPGPSPQAPARGGPVQALLRSLSRRQFLRTTAGAGLVLGAGLLLPRRAYAGDGDKVLPNPIPFSQKLPPATMKYGPFHFYFPGPADQGHEPSLITDFNGFIGVAMFSGTGTDEDGNALTFSGDMRFMKGEYVGVDRQNHRGAFAFL
jgi:hypothetical protein